ncbi:P-loop containing nucleoside triphosphate hydrolase protein [Collybia nuda]|uniref:P-loop containing nucleoside triphosphate hydrolase protein n=1 Tax=Collybia nuda TaxID=64659 RepID=A0A9P5XSR4_9AGAR|nr:P-loop containing nucleoside triphosphate hydrolase protein [Collybia nuda]KAF9456165.1 P-loop containing nucleoside triphosphate hydrolase protein [Collybia nuda]
MNAKHIKYLLHLEKQLRSLGAQADIDLPCIVVIGNQSAGKSSLLESISGITVPRDANLSTRAPFHYRMTSTSQPFSVQVHLRYEYDLQGQRRRELVDVPFGPPLLERSAVELRLRQAQTAILQNMTDSAEIDAFLETSALELPSKIKGNGVLRFSKNIVCVDVCGPNLANLSFFDLPGFIQVGPYKTLIEDLVRSYISGNCIILMVLAMNGDFESHGAVEFVREVDPDGERTIGVLTKPDLADAGDHSTRDLWYSVLTGHIEPLKYGYYCTRQPTERERESQVTTEQARIQEMDFFRNTLPYSSTSEQSRLGTENLVSTVSDLLIKLILRSIPKMQAQIQATLGETSLAIDKLPKPAPIDPTAYLLNLLRIFGDNYQRAVEGGVNGGLFIQDIGKVFENFRNDMKATSPEFCPFPNANFAFTSFHNSLDDKREILPFSLKSRYYLEDIRQHIQKTVTRELPGNVPFEANRRLILHFQTFWATLVTKCQEGIKALVVAALKRGTDETFSDYGSLMSILGGVIEKLINTKFELMNTHTLVILEVEQGPFTLHGIDLNIEETKWLKKYHDAVRNLPAPMSFSSSQSNTNLPGAPPTTTGFPIAATAPATSTANTTTRTSPGDEILLNYQVELKFMAEVRAYFDFAYKRVADSVKGHVDVLFVQGIAKDIFSHLLSSLEITGPNAAERCATYLAEDPVTARKRAELVARQKRLRGAQEELISYVNKLREEAKNIL